MSRAARPALAALSLALAAVSGCAYDPLAGTYAGPMTTTFDGDVDVTPAAGGVVSAESSTTKDADATFTIEPGTESDAIALGFQDCVVQLDRAGDTLVLQRTIECVDDSESSFEFAGDESDESSKTTVTIVDFAVRDAGDGRIALDVLADYRNEQRDSDGTKVTTEGELSAAFDGVRVAR